MKIIVLGNQQLLIEFTEEETTHPLFLSTVSRFRNKDEFEIHKAGELITVNMLDPDAIQTIGVAVDDIRELFMGDVVFDYEEVEVEPAILDEEGEIIVPATTEIRQKPKDLSNCPCFSFTPEPIPEEEQLQL
ncbi:MAG: hypothetical protein WA125_06300 [Desulfosporosinus sp.]